MGNFDAKKVKDDLVQWVRGWFDENGFGCKAVIGISGGIDSSTVAALMVEALGKERVLGVLMPNGRQSDIECSHLLCNHLGIDRVIVPIGTTVNTLQYEILNGFGEGSLSEQTTINLPPRIRMATLYAISQSVNGRVINTSNLSESHCGFDTRHGDSVGDMSPLGRLTKTEIRMLATELGLPGELVNKVPQDGLTGMTDEQAFGFTYDQLDKYIRTGVCEDEEVKQRIDDRHRKNLFKLEPMPCFEYDPTEE